MNLNSRSDKAIVNAISELTFGVVAAICGFVLPRLILSHYGSAYNGITLSIAQFIGCIELLKSGIGSVTRAALFKPLANNNAYETSEVVNATKKFMHKIAYIFLVCIVVFASLYPLLVSKEFDWFFAFTLFLILSVDTFAQYFLGLAYQMVLEADQRTYIISVVNIISVIVNTIIASILIISGFGIHIVKMGSALVYLFPPIFYMIWVKKKYRINDKVEPNNNHISQRWDAFAHQLANFINTNSDVVIITVILNLKEVSVYAIYYMIGNAIKKAINSLGSGTMAAWGNMMAKDEKEVLQKRFVQYEWFFFYVTTLMTTILALLYISFISLYTKGIDDVNYLRPAFAVLVSLSICLMCIKVPYEQLIFAAGHFKQTKKYAFYEAGIHLFLSILLTLLLGLNGIVLGVIVSTCYRLIIYSQYSYKEILFLPWCHIVKKFFFTLIVLSIGGVGFVILPKFFYVTNYINWFLLAGIVSISVFVIGSFVSLLFFPSEMRSVYGLLLSKITIRKKNK